MFQMSKESELSSGAKLCTVLDQERPKTQQVGSSRSWGLTWAEQVETHFDRMATANALGPVWVLVRLQLQEFRERLSISRPRADEPPGFALQATLTDSQPTQVTAYQQCLHGGSLFRWCSKSLSGHGLYVLGPVLGQRPNAMVSVWPYPVSL